jgi:hypothetical protein
MAVIQSLIKPLDLRLSGRRHLQGAL